MILVRRLALVTPLVATLSITAPAVAQSTFTWNNGAAIDWTTAGNWSPSTNFPGRTGNAHGNNAGDTADFASTLPSGNTVGISMSPGSNNADQLLQLGAITFSNTSNGLVIGNSSLTKDGTLRLNGATVGSQVDTVLSNTSGSQTLTIQNNVIGNQSMALTLGLTNGTAYIVGSPGATINISTVISEVGGSKALTFQGGGTLNLSGTNTYSGTTLVSAGTLNVTGTSPTGTGMVGIASPARLSGTGTITPSGSNNVQVGGRLQPGSDTAAGTLTVNSDALISGTSSQYIWSFSNSGTGSTSAAVPGASDASGQSRLAVNGNLNFQPGAIDVTGLAGLSFDNTKFYSWTVATGTTASISSTQPTFTTTNLNTGGGSFFLSSNGTSVFVAFSPVPEPASILLCCAVAAGVTGYLRRKHLPT